jgi:hypothetical protein
VKTSPPTCAPDSHLAVIQKIPLQRSNPQIPAVCDRRHRREEYIIAGPEPFPQRIPQVASLVENDVWKMAFVVGGGIEYRIHRKVLLRGEFLDYLTTFPRTQIAPAPHNTARGIFEQFTPLFGMSYVF